MDFVSDFLRSLILPVVALILSGNAQFDVMATPVADSVRQSAAQAEAEVEGEAEVSKSDNRGIPEWFVEAAVYSDHSGMLYVQTDSACMNLVQAAAALEQESLRAINMVLDQWFGTGAGEKMDLTGKDLLEHFVFQGRKEIRIDSDQELAQMSNDHNSPNERHYYCGFAQLHLDEKFRKFADTRWQAVQTGDRLVRCGLVGGSILALLAIAFGYLKMETATRGFYSRRLQTVTVLGILSIMAVAIWLKQILLSP